MNREKTTIKKDSSCFIIAELSANHNGSIETAIETIKAAKRTGADAIKLQTYTADTITLNSDRKDFIIEGTIWEGKTLYDLYAEAYTPWEWHKQLFKVAKEEGLICFSSPFDFTAVDFLETLDCPIYKIASFEITDIPLIKYVASKGKPMIMSTGIATYEPLDKMYKVNVFSPMMMVEDVLRDMLLHKTQGNIIHISSISAHTGYKGLAMYASTKGPIEAFSKNTAREWGH